METLLDFSRTVYPPIYSALNPVTAKLFPSSITRVHTSLNENCKHNSPLRAVHAPLRVKTPPHGSGNSLPLQPPLLSLPYERGTLALRGGVRQWGGVGTVLSSLLVISHHSASSARREARYLLPLFLPETCGAQAFPSRLSEIFSLGSYRVHIETQAKIARLCSLGMSRQGEQCPLLDEEPHCQGPMLPFR